MNGQITEFIKHHYRHFNAAALIDAAEGYVQHLNKGGKMMITLAGAMSSADALDPALAQQLRDAAAHAFDAGIGVTALIGAGLIVIAAVIAATTLERTASAPEH